MNTSCQQQPLILCGSGCGEHAPCGAPTLRGRTHCEAHREEELRRLDRRRQQTKRDFEGADMEYHSYLSEGYGP